MGLFSNIASSLETKATSIDDYLWQNLFPNQNAKSGVSVNVDTAMRTTTVLACARVISEGNAQIPMEFFEKSADGKSKTPYTGPEVAVFTRRPNDWMTPFEVIEQMTMHAVLTGNAYAYLGRGMGKLVEIIPLVPGGVSVTREVDWTLTYRVNDLAGRSVKVDPADILHLRGPSWNGYLGLDAVQLAREAIGLAISTEETHAALHANGAQPGGVLSVKGKLDKEAKERLKAQWQTFQGGVANRFRTAVLDVEADWKPLSMTGVDAQHLDTRKFQIEEICRAFRVFPAMVMHAEKTATYGSAQAFFQAHVTHCLMPWLRRWEEAIERALFEKQPNIIVRFKARELMRGDDNNRSDFYQKALGGARPETAWLLKNEVRAEEGYDPVDGGDEFPKPDPVAAPTSATEAKLDRLIAALERKYNPDHPRDWHGRFGENGSHASDLYKPTTKTAADIVAEHGAREHIDAVEAKLKQSVPTNASVEQGGHVMPNGEYTAERKAVHDKILRDVFNKEIVANSKPGAGLKPVLSVIGGRGGSGKSFITNAGGPVDKTKSLLLDSDKFKAALPEYAGWNAALLHEEATHLLDRADAMASKLGINVTHDATLKSEATSAARIQLYKDKGFDVDGYYVHAAPEVAASRALGRFVRGMAKDGKGRYVPPSVILGNTNNEANFDKMKKGFRKWQVYDNNGDKPVLVAEN